MKSFTISKPDGTLKSLAGSRKLNAVIKRMPYRLPKIQDLLLKLEGLMQATSFDLNMGYYQILLITKLSRMYTLGFLWENYEYLRLPMGLCNSPDIYQEKINELMEGLKFSQVYINDLLVISKGNLKECVKHVEQVLIRLNIDGLKVCMTKSKLCRDSLEYLRYQISIKGIQPISKKIKAILSIVSPRNKVIIKRFN